MARMDKVALPTEIRKCPLCANGRMMAQQAARGGGWGGGWIQHLFFCDSCGHRLVLEGAGSRAITGGSGILLIAAAIGIGIFIPLPVGPLFGLPVAALGLWAIYRDMVEPRRRCPVVDHRTEEVWADVQDAFYASDAEVEKAQRRQKIVERAVYAVLAAMVLFFAYMFLSHGL